MTKMITATRRIQFCAGHRVYGHESKCANMHGHNYVALITAEAIICKDGATPDGLDPLGRVVDFSVIKDQVGSWIDEAWDHAFIYWNEDPELEPLFSAGDDDLPGGILAEHKSFAFDANPTAENMADYLLRKICPAVLGDTGIRVSRVRLWETENCYADAEL
jgi:6-pyruvoyltetrahydropterin/6-carboxytetrahydropterin synthase